MKKTTILMAVFILNFVCYSDVIINDGGIHNINTHEQWEYAFENITIDYGFPETKSTVNFTGPYHISSGIRTYGKSTLNLYDFFHDMGWPVASYENSVVNFYSGTMPIFNVRDNSKFNFLGGYSEGLSGYGNSHIVLSGGRCAEIALKDNSHLTVTGGQIGYDLRTEDSSYVDIWGGEIFYGFESMSLPGNVDLYLQSYNYDSISKRLTGILAYGDYIDVKVGSGVEFILVPEPCTLLLLGVGGLLIKKR